MSTRNKILCCILTTYERNGWANKRLMEFLEQIHFNKDYLVSVAYADNFSSAAAARNYFFKHVKDMPQEERPDWLLMIDNDMVPPDNLLDTIKNAPEDAGVIAPRFYMWNPQKATVVLCWGMEESTEGSRLASDGAQVLDMFEGRFYPLTKCGTGAIFVKPSVIDQVGAPWFWYDLDETQASKGTEDINFCYKARAAGVKLYGNSSIEVGHFHNEDLALLARYLYNVKKEEPALAEAWK